MFSTKAYLIKNRVNKQGLAPVYIRYVYDRKPSALPVGHSVEPTKFDDSKGLVKTAYPESKIINPVIRQLQQDLEQIASSLPDPTFEQVKEAYNLYKLKKEEQEVEAAEIAVLKRRGKVIPDLKNFFDAEVIDDEIAAAEKAYLELLEKKKRLVKTGYTPDSIEAAELKRLLDKYPDSLIEITDRTRGAIKTWAKILLEFAAHTNTVLTFESFNQDFYNAYAKYLMFDSKHKYYNNNFGKHVKQLKAFLRWCETEQGKTVNRLYTKYKVLKEEKEIVFLTEEELDLLWNYRSKVSKDLVKHVDIAVFQNLTGLRYSDIKNSYWQVDNGYLKGKTQKTDGDYNIPLALDSRITEILEKYNYNMNLVSEQKFNKNIKDICKALFEEHKINKEQIAIRRMRLKQKSFDYKYKWELLTSHSGRRGFATRMYHAGYSERDILLIMGSKSNEVLKKYIRNNTDDLDVKIEAKKKNKAA